MSRDCCAVDFSTNSVQVLVRRGGDQPSSTSAQLPAECVLDGRVVNGGTVRGYLERLLKPFKVKRPEIRLAVSDSASVSRFLRYPIMPLAELKRSLTHEASRELPMNPRDAYLGWQVIEHDQKQQTVLLVGTWRDTLEGYLDVLKDFGPVTVAEPRSLALARAVGHRDVTIGEWTGDRIQVVQVEGRRVVYTTSTLVPEGAAESPMRLAHLLASILPKHRHGLLMQLVLLGRLEGRFDVIDGLGQLLGSERFRVTAWNPPEEFARLNTTQAANIGLTARG